MMNDKIIALIAIIGLALAAPVAAEPVEDSPTAVNPRITTDGSVDASTVDRILADLVSEDMGDEQKVLAVFDWVRRVMYHGDGPDSLAYDFHVRVHSLGNGSCLRQTAPMAMLLRRLGYDSRSWVHDTHHMIEVEYGGRWHCFDPHMNFWVRDYEGNIASVAQLRADSTLAWKAEEEGRAAPGYLLCGDSPRWFTGGGDWHLEDGWPDVTVDEPFGQIELRRGEFVTFNWTPNGRYWDGAWKFDYGPYHTCGPADRLDEPNWPIYEPHKATVNGVESYRHWAAGEFVYYPDLYSDNYQDGVVRMRNMARLCPCFVMMPQDIRRPGEVVLELQSPYIITGGSFALQKGEESGDITAEISVDGQQTWIPVETENTRDSTRASYTAPIEGHRGKYHLKIVLAGDASLSTMEITTDFMHNPYALPYLKPGINTVGVHTDRIGALFRVQWRYAEGPDWDEPVEISRTFQQPGEFEIYVAGEKYPRNLSLTYGVLP